MHTQKKELIPSQRNIFILLSQASLWRRVHLWHMMYSMLVAQQAETQPHRRRRPLLNVNAVQYCLDLDKRSTLPPPPNPRFVETITEGNRWAFIPMTEIALPALRLRGGTPSKAKSLPPNFQERNQKCCSALSFSYDESKKLFISNLIPCLSHQLTNSLAPKQN